LIILLVIILGEEYKLWSSSFCSLEYYAYDKKLSIATKIIHWYQFSTSFGDKVSFDYRLLTM
jgi:hypothetical protein